MDLTLLLLKWPNRFTYIQLWVRGRIRLLRLYIGRHKLAIVACLAVTATIFGTLAVSARAAEAYNVNTTTGVATAQEGTTTLQARGGTGTVTYDLKNGEIILKQVQLATALQQVNMGVAGMRTGVWMPPIVASPTKDIISSSASSNAYGKIPDYYLSSSDTSTISISNAAVRSLQFDCTAYNSNYGNDPWYSSGRISMFYAEVPAIQNVPTVCSVIDTTTGEVTGTTTVQYSFPFTSSNSSNMGVIPANDLVNTIALKNRQFYYRSNTKSNPLTYNYAESYKVTSATSSSRTCSVSADIDSYYGMACVYARNSNFRIVFGTTTSWRESDDDGTEYGGQYITNIGSAGIATKLYVGQNSNGYWNNFWITTAKSGTLGYTWVNTGTTIAYLITGPGSLKVQQILTPQGCVYTPKTVQVPVCERVSGASAVKKVTFANCITNGQQLNASFAPDVIPIGVSGTEVIIDGGTYKGSPAVSGNNVTVRRGTFEDTNNTSSTFLIDADSERTTTKDGTTTIMTVKLANPPVIIDWADFPGIDLDIDLAAPVIEVIRNPADSRTPTNQVVLTIKATDPNGNDDPKPISVNGGAFQASPCQYVVTENQTVQITARDANGNTRDYNCTINNIDTQKPEITGFKQSTEAWTKDRVKVSVEATDDVKLHPDGPYRYRFTPNKTGVTSTWSGWTLDRTYYVSENGTLEVEVRDALGKSTTDSYAIGNIDTVAPTFTYELSPPAGTLASKNTGVVIDLTLVNTGDPITGEASPMSSSPVRWDPSEPWSSDTTRTVYENGVYNIQVRDSCGNTSAIIPVTVNNVSTAMPVIDSFTGDHMRSAFVTSPATLKVTAHATSGSLAARPYSWDGGKTWTSVSEFKAYYNGECEVQVKDATGNITSATLVISNIDSIAPTASVYLYKGIPADWDFVTDGPCEVEDYVWKIRVDAEDNLGGSGIEQIQTLWDGGSHSSPTGIVMDVEEPGVYGIVVTDKAGNRTYAEKVVTYESIGQSAGGNGNNDAYIGIAVPSTGSAGSPFNDGTSIGDLVYSKTGVFKKPSGPMKAYESGKEGINVNLIAQAKKGNWLSGYATFDGVKYPITFSGRDGPVKVTERDGTPAEVFIPIAGITRDISNGRLVTVFQEWADENMTELVREGSSTLYTSTQVSEPNIQWTYDKANDEMVIVANSAVAGLPDGQPMYSLDGGATWLPYTGPFGIAGHDKVIIKATDNAGNTTQLELDTSTIAVAGGGGGSLPTGGVDGSVGVDGNPVNSYYISGRTSEAYIIGGPRSNTNSIPSSEVFASITG